jgi:hypothetical protein
MGKIDKAIEGLGGLHATARLLGLSVRSIAKWRDNGYLPRTEATGETDYSERMARALAAKTGEPEQDIREGLLATVRKRKPTRC